jgi:hypothetical protein
MMAYEPVKSKKIEQEITRWRDAGRLNKIRANANYILGTSRARNKAFLSGVSTIANVLEKPPTLWMAEVGHRKYLFISNTEDAVITRFGTLVPKVNMKTPKSVLVKMMVKRIPKILENFQAKDESINGTKAFKFLKSKKVSVKQPLELDNVKAVRNALEIIRKNFISFSLRTKFVDSIEAILDKPLMDDQVMKEVWDIICVKHIMES